MLFFLTQFGDREFLAKARRREDAKKNIFPVALSPTLRLGVLASWRKIDWLAVMGRAEYQRIFSFLMLWAAIFCGMSAVVSAEDSAPLLRVGRSPVTATLVRSAADGTIQFETDGKVYEISLAELVRWSTPVANQRVQQLILVDGSRLVLAEAWTGKPTFQLEDETATVTTPTFGTLSFDRQQLRAIVIRPCQLQSLERLLTDHNKLDRVLLAKGDLLTGRVNMVGHRLTILLDGQDSPVEVPMERIAAIALNSSKRASSEASVVVGLRDGSVVHATALVADQKNLRITSAGGIAFVGRDRREVVSIRSLKSDAVYLSDLVADDYRHVPYLKIPWPYRRDRNARGGLLSVGGRVYAKGLGTYTAARLTYDLTKKHNRFVATVAVDDEAGDRGSVIFRVYLLRDGAWQPAFASPILRGGQPPMRVLVTLDGAEKIAILSDYADRGDERDYADWLDARLE